MTATGTGPGTSEEQVNVEWLLKLDGGGHGAVDVTVTVNGVKSNAYRFTVK